jgi:hypothetical protein
MSQLASVVCSLFRAGAELTLSARNAAITASPPSRRNASVWLPVRVFNIPISVGPAKLPTFAIIVTRAIPAAAAGPVKN